MNNIKDMLESRGLQTEGVTIKLARHIIKDETDDVKAFVVRSAKNFAEWQCIQSTSSHGKNFRGCKFVVSFCYLREDCALFTGVFRNESKEPAAFDIDWHLSPELAEIYRGRPRRARYFFELRRDARFADLERRVIVEWGSGGRAWVQNFDPDAPKRIQRVLPEPRWIFDEGYGA